MVDAGRAGRHGRAGLAAWPRRADPRHAHGGDRHGYGGDRHARGGEPPSGAVRLVPAVTARPGGPRPAGRLLAVNIAACLLLLSPVMMLAAGPAVALAGHDHDLRA